MAGVARVGHHAQIRRAGVPPGEDDDAGDENRDRRQPDASPPRLGEVAEQAIARDQRDEQAAEHLANRDLPWRIEIGHESGDRHAEQDRAPHQHGAAGGWP